MMKSATVLTQLRTIQQFLDAHGITEETCRENTFLAQNEGQDMDRFERKWERHDIELHLSHAEGKAVDHLGLTILYEDRGICVTYEKDGWSINVDVLARRSPLKALKDALPMKEEGVNLCSESVARTTIDLIVAFFTKLPAEAAVTTTP